MKLTKSNYETPLTAKPLKIPVSKSFLFLALFMMLASGCAELITPKVKKELHSLREGEYRIDSTHTTILFKVSHLGLSSYIGRFNEFDATLSFDPENPENSVLEATVNTTSIDVNNSFLENTLRGSSWLDSDNYPQAIFTTQSVSKTSDNQLLFTGNLNLRDKTVPIDLLIQFNGGANNVLSGKYTIGFLATGKFKRSDFGIDGYIPAIGDEVEIEVYAEFQKQ